MSRLYRQTSQWQDDNFVKELRRYGFDTATWVLDWIADTFSPEEVFEESELVAWAESNGYVLKGDE